VIPGAAARDCILKGPPCASHLRPPAPVQLMIGGKACVTDELKALVAHLHKIVLIININYDEAARERRTSCARCTGGSLTMWCS